MPLSPQNKKPAELQEGAVMLTDELSEIIREAVTTSINGGATAEDVAERVIALLWLNAQAGEAEGDADADPRQGERPTCVLEQRFAEGLEALRRSMRRAERLQAFQVADGRCPPLKRPAVAEVISDAEIVLRFLDGAPAPDCSPAQDIRREDAA
jgi:hypothetical protein